MKRPIFILVGILLLFYVFYLAGNHFLPTYKVATRISYSEEDSKERGVYMWSYESKDVILNDSIDFKIETVFSEKQFVESKNNIQVRKGDSSQVKLILAKDIVLNADYNTTWVIKGLNYHGNGFIKKYNDCLPPDTIWFEVYMIKYRSPRQPQKQLGKFYITKRLPIVVE